MKLKANATAKDAMSGEMVEQTHAMCLQQTNQTMMTVMTKDTMMTNETHETVLMPMNFTNTTAEEIETISLRSSSAPFFKTDEQFDPVDYAMTFSATLRAHTLSVFQQLEANYSHMINDTQQDASDIDTVPLRSIRAPILLILLFAYTIYSSKITDKTIKMHATTYRFALSSPIIGAPMFLVSFSVAGIAIITHAICNFFAYLFDLAWYYAIDIPLWRIRWCFYLMYSFYPPLTRSTIESAFMMSGDDDPNDWDARKYPRCKPYYGKKGVQWNNFVRDFSISLLDDSDADATLKETMLGTDPGGDVYLAGGGAPLTVAGTARRNKRLTKLYAALYRHVADLRLREMIDTEAPDNGRDAYKLLDRHCRRDVTDLEMFDLDKQWDASSIPVSVGVNLDSIIMFSRHLSGLNALRPAGRRKDADDMTKKLLSCITPDLSASLSLDAQKELRAPAGSRAFESGGHRDFAAAVQAIDELWRSQFEQGAIKPQATRGSARPDASALAAFDANAKTFTIEDLRAERQCFNCRGFGHIRADCPSAWGNRPIGACIDLLRQSITKKVHESASSSQGSQSQGTKFGSGGVKQQNSGGGEQPPKAVDSEDTEGAELCCDDGWDDGY